MELLEGQDLAAGPDVRLHRVWDTLYEFQEEAASRPLGDPSVEALAALAEVALTPLYVVSDTLDLEYVRTGRPCPTTARVYFGRSEAYIDSGEAGWLADDPDDPFSGTWVPRDEVRRHLPEVEAAVDEIFSSPAARQITALDRWVQAATPDAAVAPPPLPLPDAQMVADSLVADLAPIVDEAFAARLGRRGRRPRRPASPVGS